MKKLKIIAALDSFKGAVSSYEAGCAVRRGILRRIPETDCEVIVFALGDGGEGTSEAFFNSGEVHTLEVSDTHLAKTCAKYVIVQKCGVKTAIFEMASASGLHFSRAHGLKIMSATTAGVGEMIAHLAKLGCDEIIVGLGGSGTNDGGIGALERMGAKFYNISGAQIDCTTGAAALSEIFSCDLSEVNKLLSGIKLTLLYDAAVPLTGEYGASMMFSHQKGANADDAQTLDMAMSHYAKICDSYIGCELSKKNGCGAAGGLGYGLSLAGGELQPGAEYVLEFVKFREAAKNADLIITGEGKTDLQTVYGKLPSIVARNSEESPVVCLCGTFCPSKELYNEDFSAIFSIINAPITLEEAMSATVPLLEESAYNLAGLIKAQIRRGERGGRAF